MPHLGPIVLDAILCGRYREAREIAREEPRVHLEQFNTTLGVLSTADGRIAGVIDDPEWYKSYDVRSDINGTVCRLAYYNTNGSLMFVADFSPAMVVCAGDTMRVSMGPDLAWDNG